MFLRQPGLKVVVSPNMMELVSSPASRRLLFSPQSALVVTSPAKSPSGSGAEEVFPGKGGLFPAATLFPSRVEVGALVSSSAECLELPSRVP